MYLGIQAVLLLAAAGLSSLVWSQNVVDLSGDGWTVSNKGLAISVPGKLPSHVQLDLYAAGVTGKSDILEYILFVLDTNYH